MRNGMVRIGMLAVTVACSLLIASSSFAGEVGVGRAGTAPDCSKDGSCVTGTEVFYDGSQKVAEQDLESVPNQGTVSAETKQVTDSSSQQQ
jgi:hypothetical protein